MFVLPSPLYFLLVKYKKVVTSFDLVSVNDHLNAPVEIKAILTLLNSYEGSLFHNITVSILEMIQILFTDLFLQGKNFRLSEQLQRVTKYIFSGNLRFCDEEYRDDYTK